MADLITGLFHDRTEAERAVNDLQDLGYSQNDISVMMNDRAEARDFAEGTGTMAAEGAGVGAGIGGTLGAIIAALTATGSVAAVAATGGLAAPLVAGPLAAALAGAGAGGLTGGIIGGLVGAGIPEGRAAGYETGLNAGGILLGVHATNAQAPEVRRILERDGADDVQGPSGYRGNTAAQTDFVDTAAPAAVGTDLDADPEATRTDYVPPPMRGLNSVAPASGNTNVGTTREVTGETPERIQLREEQLRANTQQVSAGAVHVHKEIITETKTIDVPVTREEVVVERHAVGGPVTGSAADFSQPNQDIRIPIMEEQVSIEKTPVVREEVEIGKRQVTETQHLTGSVQREELRIDDPTDHRSDMVDTDQRPARTTTNR